MDREYWKWFSPNLKRDMELLVFGHAGARTLVFPTREGRFFDYENWRLVAASAEAIEAGHLQLFCVDSVDSEGLYCRACPAPSRIAKHKQFERYIVDEVLPFTESKNRQPFLIAHGCSIGAYHAMNIALRHPTRFHKVVAFSGRYDLTKQMGGFEDLFGGYYDEDIYFHTPNHFIPQMSDPELLNRLGRMDITMVIGEDDPFRQSNIDLSESLSSKGVRNRLVTWEGEAHRACYWRKMVKLFL